MLLARSFTVFLSTTQSRTRTELWSASSLSLRDLDLVLLEPLTLLLPLCVRETDSTLLSLK
jgi:hypothetical protein